MQSTMRWRLPLNTFPSRSPCCGPASCGKAERSPRAWGFSWHGQKWQPHPSRSPWGGGVKRAQRSTRGEVPPIGFPVWCGSRRTHIHRGFGVAPNQVEAKSVMVERWGDRETWAAGSPPMRGGWVFIVAPISALLQPDKPSSEGPRIVAGTSSPLWYRLCSTSRPGASRESVIVGNRGPVVEGHHFPTPCFRVFCNIHCNSPSFPRTFGLKPQF